MKTILITLFGIIGVGALTIGGLMLYVIISHWRAVNKERSHALHRN
jgi:hypothetical protein